MDMKLAPLVRVGLPLPGGQLVAAARAQRYPVLFSANAFARSYAKGHERAGWFKDFRLPCQAQFEGLDVALDSGGFVAAARYGDYRWTVDDYLDLVQSHRWSWWAALDMCCEPEIAADRPLRLLRLAATARLLAECRSEARRRGLDMPMPVLQGWTPDEYALCASRLPIAEWPDLVGLGSVCRRPLKGPTGLLAVLEAVDAVLPSHTRLHLFGVKSSALRELAAHPRVASVDSMAWDFAARVERRRGRDMAYRIEHLQAWTTKQRRTAAAPVNGAAWQRALFDPAEFAGVADREAVALEALALVHAELVMSGDLEYRSAVWDCWRDGVTLIAMLRQGASGDDLDELIAGLGQQFEVLCDERGVR